MLYDRGGNNDGENYERGDENDRGKTAGFGEGQREQSHLAPLLFIRRKGTTAASENRDYAGDASGDGRNGPAQQERAKNNQPAQHAPAHRENEEPTIDAGPPFPIFIARPAAGQSCEDKEPEEKRNREDAVKLRNGYRLGKELDRRDPERGAAKGAGGDHGQEFKEAKTMGAKKQKHPGDEMNYDAQPKENGQGVRLQSESGQQGE
jgi:hypothetical protein